MAKPIVEGQFILCKENGLEFTYFNCNTMIACTDFYFKDLDFHVFFWRSEKMVFCGYYVPYGMLWCGDFDASEEYISIHATYDTTCTSHLALALAALKEAGFIKGFKIDESLYCYVKEN